MIFKEVWDTWTSEEADNSFLMVRQTQHIKPATYRRATYYDTHKHRSLQWV